MMSLATVRAPRALLLANSRLFSAQAVAVAALPSSAQHATRRLLHSGRPLNTPSSPNFNRFSSGGGGSGGGGGGAGSNGSPGRPEIGGYESGYGGGGYQGGYGGGGGGGYSYGSSGGRGDRYRSLPMNTIIRFVPQQTAWIVERMGKYHRILEPGLAILIPFLDRIAYVKSLKEVAMEIPSQSAITADNVTLELDGVLYTRVLDAYKASYGVEDAEYAISQLAQTTMRSEIGMLSLDSVLRERAQLNTNITAAINDAASAWGVTCLRYEIRDIHAPDGVVEAMHRQVTAERSKRAEILESEGQRQSAINLAEGQKESVILASQAIMAETINRANGDAEAILKKARATAEGIRLVAEQIAAHGPDAQGAMSLSVAEKYVEAFAGLARESTAVVVPGNVGDLGGMIAAGLSVYGKVGEAQARRALGVNGSGGGGGGSAGAGEAAAEGHKATTDKSMAERMKESIVEGFTATAQRK